jgi:hypothetical protein
MASLPRITGDGPASQAALPTSDYIQPNLGHGLRIWWAFYWRNTLIALVLSLQLKNTISWLVGKGLLPDASQIWMFQAGSVALNYIPAAFVMYYVFKKRFRTFRIQLTSIPDGTSTQILPLTPKRVFRIWWTYTWRTAVYTVVLLVAMNVPLGFVTGAVTVISPTLGQAFSQLMGVVIAGAVGLFVIYSNILDEEISDFNIGLVPREAATVIPSAEIEPAAETKGPAAS